MFSATVGFTEGILLSWCMCEAPYALRHGSERQLTSLFAALCCVQDKAALLAGMEPDAVARLLGCMDPNEAVLLLSALGDGSSKMVVGHLSGDERDRMIEVG